MATIEGLRVVPLQLAHGFGEIPLWRFHQQMEMVVHQAIGMKQEMKPGDDARQRREKLLSVLVIQKDVLSRIPPGGDVIERPGEFEAEWSGHARESSSPFLHRTNHDPADSSSQCISSPTA